jgi:hypothetical protein
MASIPLPDASGSLGNELATSLTSNSVWRPYNGICENTVIEAYIAHQPLIYETFGKVVGPTIVHVSVQFGPKERTRPSRPMMKYTHAREDFGKWKN